MVKRNSVRVAFLGLRGFPGVQGGVETHSEHLCPLLVDLGCDVDVIVRSAYQSAEFRGGWGGVRFKCLWSPKRKGLEAILHTFIGVLYAGLVSRPDVLHIQAIGPALMTPLARLLGLKVVVTHHGPDYDRQKWGRVGRMVLKLGERFGMRWASSRIVISEVIREIVWQKHGVASTLIHNGVVLPEVPTTRRALEKWGLLAGKYVLLVSRLVAEKRHLDLIAAFQAASLKNWHLVIVGSADHPDGYTRQVLDAASATPNVVCTGFQTGVALRELYGHAGLFVLPSSHEGLPIAMLEALSYGLPVLASDIPANLEVGLPARHYYPLGDVNGLSSKLGEFAGDEVTDKDREARRSWVMEKYDWQAIAKQTFDVYREVVVKKIE